MIINRPHRQRRLHLGFRFILMAYLLAGFSVGIPNFAAAKGIIPAFPSSVGAPADYEMNGIRLSDYPNFESKWKLVTVRFREDTKEQRFIYANPTAYAALLKGVTDYPKGSVFAKIGVMTQDDPAFPDSKVPSGTQRIQFMVRDKKKYAATDGWGFALFRLDGRRMDIATPVEKQSQACNACHLIVQKTRGDIFAQPAHLRAFPAPPTGAVRQVSKRAFTSEQAHFIARAAGQLPKKIRELLPRATRSVRFLDGTLRRHVFSGTLDEVRPLLMQEAERSNLPAILLASDNWKMFVLAIPINDVTKLAPIDPKKFMVVNWAAETAPCPKGVARFRIYSGDSIHTPVGDEYQMFAQTVCAPR